MGNISIWADIKQTVLTSLEQQQLVQIIPLGFIRWEHWRRSDNSDLTAWYVCTETCCPHVLALQPLSPTKLNFSPLVVVLMIYEDRLVKGNCGGDRQGTGGRVRQSKLCWVRGSVTWLSWPNPALWSPWQFVTNRTHSKVKPPALHLSIPNCTDEQAALNATAEKPFECWTRRIFYTLWTTHHWGIWLWCIGTAKIICPTKQHLIVSCDRLWRTSLWYYWPFAFAGTLPRTALALTQAS